MKKALLILGLIVCLLGGLAGGAYLTDRMWGYYMSPVFSRYTVIPFQTCLYMVDSEMVRFVVQADSYRLEKLLWRMEKCGEFLDQAAGAAEDEEASGLLGEIHLFYDGYEETLKEIIETQVRLELLYHGFELGETGEDTKSSILRLTEKQTEALAETYKFLQRLELLVVEFWK